MKDDGGPAFPQSEKKSTVNGCPYIEINGGMSLRDYFAAAALCGWVSAKTRQKPASLAQYCYRQADAMLAEREKSAGT